MKKIFILMAMIFQMLCVFCEDSESMYIKNAANQYYNGTGNQPYGTNWLYGRSSELKNVDAYSFMFEYLSDGDKNTAWCGASKNSGINEFVLFNVRELDEFGFYSGFNYDSAIEKGIDIKFLIYNGLCSSEKDFHKFNMVKKTLVQFYEVAKIVGQDSIIIDGLPILLSQATTELDDSILEQSFDFHIDLDKKKITSTPDVIMKFTILDVYRGTDYEDTCISEIKVYGEYAE
ncbi:MAG: hypothetical protein K2J68_10990 [Treponemataceae bacterium]|nr:hypothetical protein [Treponemataceae bacterium]